VPHCERRAGAPAGPLRAANRALTKIRAVKIPSAGGGIEGNQSMKIMIRRSDEVGLSIYVPKKDLEEPIVESEFESLWGGWIKIANGWVLDLPAMAADTRLPITVEAKKRAEEE
jgi:nitrogen fixation protein NifT